MTREEAIQHFKEQLDIFGGEHAEAIKMAIEALSEETSTIQEKHQLSEETSTNTPTKSTNISTDASADRPKGEWIHTPNGIDRDFVWWTCSECGHKIFSETEKDRIEFHAYCGRCGADMRSE